MAGAAAGAAAGALADIGIDDNFMKELGATLKPGSSALFVLVRKVTPDKVLEAVRGIGGKVLKTSLSHDDEAKLQAALDAARRPHERRAPLRWAWRWCAWPAPRRRRRRRPDPAAERRPVRFKTADLDGSGGLTQDEAIKGGFSSNALRRRRHRQRPDRHRRRDRRLPGRPRPRVGRTPTAMTTARSAASEAAGSPELKDVFNSADRDADGILRKQEHEAWAQTSLYQNVDLPYVVPNIINKKF